MPQQIGIKQTALRLIFESYTAKANGLAHRLLHNATRTALPISPNGTADQPKRRHRLGTTAKPPRLIDTTNRPRQKAQKVLNKGRFVASFGRKR